MPIHSTNHRRNKRAGGMRARLQLGLLGVFAAWLGWYAAFGSSGLAALHRKRAEYNRELARVAQLERENEQLHAAIRSLQSDPATIESIARSQLHLTRPGEVIYTYGGGSEAEPMADNTAKGH